MIQRVQSVYLLLVTVLMSIMLIRPYAELMLADGRILTFHTYIIKQHTESKTSSTYKTTFPVILIVLTTAVLSFVCIFLFSRRIIQLRICLINIMLLVLLLIIMYIYYSSAKHSTEVTGHAFRLPAIFPLVAVFLYLLAYKNVQSDEMLVKSYNRIR